MSSPKPLSAPVTSPVPAPVATPAAAPATVTLEKAAKKALAAFIKRPSATNYNAMLFAMRAVQNDYIAEFQIGEK